MILNLELCCEFLYNDLNFWQTAKSIWDKQLCHDTSFVTYLSTLNEHLTLHPNIPAAEKTALALKTYTKNLYGELHHMALPIALGLILPESLKLFEANPISSDIIHATFQDFTRWAKNYKYQFNTQGIGELPWILYPFAKKIYKIGRLQYELTDFPFPYYIYQNTRNHQITVLAEGGLPISEDGYIVGTNGRTVPQSFTTSLECVSHTLLGYAADLASGTLNASKVTLALDTHKLILAPGLPVINLHIPAGEPFTPEAVDASLKEAKHFFKEQGIDFQIALCESWLLDIHITHYAPENSHIIHFMKRFMKFPIYCMAPSVGKFVFDLNFVWPHYETFTPHTSLQKNLRDYLLIGGEVFETAGVLLL